MGSNGMQSLHLRSVDFRVAFELLGLGLDPIILSGERAGDMKKLLVMIMVATGAVLAACGGGGDDAPLGVANNTTLATNATTAAAVINQPFAFPAGVPAFGTTSATTVQFTSTSTVPAFSVASAQGTASGSTSFGSCIFAVTQSTFPAGHPLALNQTVTVNPCNMNVNTAGAVANGVATSRSVALVLGAASSAGASVTVGVNAGGQLTLNGNIVATVVLTPVSG
jgi:hypothetical protein